jgi:CBS-domain-containing membrane protein
MLVRVLMTPDPVTVSPGTPVKTALRLLAEHEISAMPVLDRHGRLRGVVSEADLIRDLVSPDPRTHELAGPEEPLDRPRVVNDVMSAHAVTVHPETDLALAVELITSTTVKSLPVLDHDERVVGMLSRSDVVRVLARADDDLARDVDTRLASVGLDDWVADVTDGSVSLTGPEGSPDRAMAYLVAGTVPGVVEVSRD